MRRLPLLPLGLPAALMCSGVRRFACILEDDPGVERWFKPAKGQFQIFYRHQHQDQPYEPDFAVETKTESCCANRSGRPK